MQLDHDIRRKAPASAQMARDVEAFIAAGGRIDKSTPKPTRNYATFRERQSVARKPPT